MLKYLRKKTKIIIWAVLISFVAWGGYTVSLTFNPFSRAAGKIFGKEVPFQDFNMASRTVQIFTPVSDQDNPPDAKMLEARAWEFLILSREARRRQIKVSDAETRSAIIQMLSQKFKTALAPDQYTQWVRATLREEPRDFESQVREHLRVRKLLQSLEEELPEKNEEALKGRLLELFRSARIEVYSPRSS